MSCAILLLVLAGMTAFQLSKEGYETRTTRLSGCWPEMTLQLSKNGEQACTGNP